MKNLIFILLLSAQYGFGQAKIMNTSLVVPDTNIVYRFGQNYLQVTGLELDSTVLLTTSSGDTLLRLGYSSGYFFSFDPGLEKVDTIYAFQNNEIVSEKVMYVGNLQNPKIYFGTIRESTVTKQILLENPTLFATYEPQLAKCRYSIRAFNGTIIKRNGRKTLFEQTGNCFDEENLKRIRKLKPGDTLIVQGLKTITPDGPMRNQIVNLRLTII